MSKELRKSFQLLLCGVGILISVYAYHVETSKETDSSYTALCDINSRVSCTKVFSSKWGRGMGLLEDYIGRDHVLNQPNSVFGIMYYLIVVVLELIPNTTAARVEMSLSLLSVASCVWLAYILLFVLQDICVVCCTMYVVNVCLLAGSLLRYAGMKSQQSKKQK